MKSAKLSPSLLHDHIITKGDEVLSCLNSGLFCTLIGPRFSGKSEVLKYVLDALRRDTRTICLSINLFEINSTRQQTFHTEIIKQLKTQLRKLKVLQGLELKGAWSWEFVHFIEDLFKFSNKRIIFILDHLEAVPKDILLSFLKNLRKLFEQNGPRFLVLTSGALSLASITDNAVSPFRNISRRVLIRNIGQEESERLVNAFLSNGKIEFSRQAQKSLVEAAMGDGNLIRLLSARVIQHASRLPSRRLSIVVAKQVIDEFIEQEAAGYAPIQEGLRIIENDPDLLTNILKLLHHGSVPKNELLLPLSPDIDPLYLTGLVREVGNEKYHILNQVCLSFLKHNLNPGRVGRLFMAQGRWSQAIQHLAESLQSGNSAYRSDLMAASINAMYAADDVSEAAYYQVQGLSLCFGVDDVNTWLETGAGAALELVGHQGGPVQNPVGNQKINLDEDRLEVRVYNEGVPLQGQDRDSCLRRVFPLVPGNKPIGVVTFCEPSWTEAGEHQIKELELDSYIHQGARAISEIQNRFERDQRLKDQGREIEQRTRLLSLINKIGSLSLTINEPEKVFHLILTCITANFGLSVNRAWLFIYEPNTNSLTGRMAVGDLTSQDAFNTWERVGPQSFEQYLEHLLRGEIEYSVINPLVKKYSIPLKTASQEALSTCFFGKQLIPITNMNVDEKDSAHEFIQAFDIQNARLVPMLARDECWGVIVVDNRFNGQPISLQDEEILTIFANLAAASQLNIRQQEGEKYRREFAEALIEAAKLVGETLNLQTILKRALDQMATILPFDSASIQLYDGQLGGLSIKASKGFGDEENVEKIIFPLDAKTYPNARVWKEKRPLFFGNIQDKFPHFSDPYYQVTKIHSWLGVPLVVGSRPIGVITLDSAIPNLYTQAHVQYAMSFTGSIALLIRNAMLYTEEQERSQRLEALRISSGEITRLVTTKKLKEVLNSITRSVCVVTKADSAIIYPYLNNLGVFDINNIGSHNIRFKKSFSLKVRQEPNSLVWVVMQEPHPVIVDDVTSKKDRTGTISIWAEPDKFLEREGICSFVGIGLRVGEEKIGNLFVNFREPHTFSSTDMKGIAIFASQATVAIQQSRLFERGNKDHKTLMGTQSIAGTIGESDRDIWSVFLQSAISITNAKKGRVILANIDKNVLMDEAFQHGLTESDSATFGHHEGQACNFIRQVFNTRVSKLIVDTSLEITLPCCTELFSSNRSVLAVPVVDTVEVTGVILLASPAPAAFKNDDRELIENLAEYVSIALQSNQRYKVIKDNVELQERLLRAGKVMLGELDLNHVLLEITDSLRKSTGSDIVTLYRYDEIHDKFDFPPATSGEVLNQDAIQLLGYVSRKSVIRKAMELKRPYVAKNAQTDPFMNPNRGNFTKLGNQSFVERERITSSASFPLVKGDRPLGVLFINFREPHKFKSNEFNTITLFSELAAVAIENAHLFNLETKHRKHLEAVYDASKTITASVGMNQRQILNSILEQAVDSITGLVGSKASIGTIQLVDEKKRDLVFECVYPSGARNKFRTKLGSRLPLDEQEPGKPRGITISVALSRKPRLENDIRKCDDYIEYLPSTRSELAVPIIAKDGTLIGVIDLESDLLDTFDDDDQDAMLRLADLATVALDNMKQGEKLAQANTVAVMGAWGAEITHEVIPAVGKINLLCFTLESRADLPPEVRESIQEIEKYAGAISLPSLPGEPIDPNADIISKPALLDNVALTEVKRMRMDRPSVTWSVKLGCPDTRIKMGEEWTRRIMRHLLKNAFRAIPSGKIPARVSIRTFEKEGFAHLLVHDSGQGVPDLVRDQLFRRQIGGERPQRGRGLMLVRYVMEMHGGTIELSSTRVGQGSSFLLRFPISTKVQ